MHFSQLSAWLKSSRGQSPKNVLFRITIPGEAFSSKFTVPPEHHYFPRAGKWLCFTEYFTVRTDLGFYSVLKKGQIRILIILGFVFIVEVR